MAKTVIGNCPICKNKLTITTLKCNDCDTTISGEFSLSRFDYLTPSQQEFALVFLKNAGNIKAIEEELNISYPTVKKLLDEVIVGLGFEEINEVTVKLSKEEILKGLKEGKITFEEAERMLDEGDYDD